MKNVFALALVLASASFAHAADADREALSTMHNPRVAPCLAKLHRLQNRYELVLSEVTRDEQGKDITTKIRYSAIQGGDMMMGNVTLTINEKLVPQWGFPETSGRPVVQDCSIEKNLVR